MERVLCVLVLSLEMAICQFAQSPCPGVFDYSSDGSNIYGVIHLMPSEPVSSLQIRTNFTVAVQLFSNYVGKIEADDSNRLLQRYNAGMPVSFRVYFPVTSPLPRLTDLSVNGQTLCYGPAEYPKPGQYVTSLSLQHTSFVRGGSYTPTDTYNSVPQRRPDPVLEVFGNQGEDQVFTFNNIDSQSWNNNDDSPYYIINTTRPVFDQPTPIYKKPSRPTFGQYPTKPLYEQPRPQTRPQVFTKPTYYQPTPRPTYPSRVTSGRPVYPPTVRPPNQSVLDSIFDPEQTEPHEATVAPAVDRYPSEPVPSRNIECGEIAGGNERVPLIFDGKSYERGELPWLVAIYKGRRGMLNFICGGTLVSDRHIVTAAHCMHRRSELTAIQDFVVRVGVHNLNDWGDDITLTRTVIAASIHESYNATTLENDILVFTFNKRVEFNTYIRPACLWNGNTDLSRVVGASGVVAGWGDQGTSELIGQGKPQMVTIPIVSHAQCKASKTHFHFITSSKTLCAGDRNGAGPCRGDSGGGLYLLDGGKWRLRGVVSVSLRQPNGDNTCNLMEYVVFTDTAQYLPWIRNVMSKKYYD